MKIVNLTPHTVRYFHTYVSPSDCSWYSYPSQGLARREQINVELLTPPVDDDNHCLLKTVHPLYGMTTGLPDPVEGIVYIVSTIVASDPALAGRTDLIVPNSGPGSAIYEQGTLVGVRSFLSLRGVVK